MARPAKKSVYERIEEKQRTIIETEALLEKLHSELKELYSEKDELEMRQLFQQMKENNLDLKTALEKLNSSN